MKSNRRQIVKRLNREITKRNDAAGFAVVNTSRARIVDYGLVLTSRMLGGITHDHDASGVVIGSPIQDPPYPFFLHNGFRHSGRVRSNEREKQANPDSPIEPGAEEGELVGPFPFLTEGLDDAKGVLFRIYGSEMRA